MSSLRSIYNASGNEFVFQKIETSEVDIDNVAVNTSGGGAAATTIACTDSSIIVANVSGGYNIEFNNKATANLDLQSNNLINVNALSLVGEDNATIIASDGLQFNVNSGAFVRIYDEVYNKPTLNDVITAGNSALGNDIVDIGNLSCTKYLTVGNAISDTSQIHLCYTDGTTTTSNIQLAGSADGFAVQYYPNGINPVTTLNVSNTGVINVSNGSQTGRLFDDTIYTPQAILSTVSTLAYTNIGAVNQDITGNTPIQWFNPDTVNTIGTIGIVLSITGDGAYTTFTNTTGDPIIINISAYCIWNTTGNTTSARALWVQRNGNNSDRYGQVDRTAGNDNPSTLTNCNLVMNPNDDFQVYAWNNDPGVAYINNALVGFGPASRIMITRLK